VESLNSLLNQEFKKDKGQFFTPKGLVKVIIKRLMPYIKSIPFENNLRILDPAMGEGIFFETLIEFIDEIPGKLELFGLDIDPRVVKTVRKDSIAKYANLQLLTTNFLLKDIFTNESDKMDVCFGNPPHNARYSKLDWKEIVNKDYNEINLKFPSESAIFFVLKSLNLLKHKGILGFILPKPLIYSIRWINFRIFLLTRCNLLEVLDLGNQFSDQLQEQCLVIIEKNDPDGVYKTGYWNYKIEKFVEINYIRNNDAMMCDNLLVSVTKSELKIIKRLYNKSYENLKITAFRGISSSFRQGEGDKPLIEKSSLASGFLMPNRSYNSSKVPRSTILRQQVPKILAQRIISYKTKPKFRFGLKLWVDNKGIKISHETVINIIPSYLKDTDFSLAAVAGLLKSSFIEWWLRHAVYTKTFVTSKDFDRKYINRSRVPKIKRRGNKKSHEQILKLIEKELYEDILSLVWNFNPIDQLYCISEVYRKFQEYGEQLKAQVQLHSKLFQISAINETDIKISLKNFRKIYRNLMKEDSDFFQGNSEIYKIYQRIQRINQTMEKLQSLIDKIVFFLYKITPEEEKIICGERN
jgi:hypothetical protein